MARSFKILGQNVTFGSTQKRVFGVGREDDYFGMVTQNSFGVNTGLYSRLDAYEGITYACIDRIAATYAKYEPVIERRKGKDVVRVDDHDFLKLLHNPAGTGDKAVPMSLFDLLYATASLIELQGDVYWYLPRGSVSGKPKEIIILRADKVGQDIDKNTGDVTGFFVKTNQGASRIDIAIDEMLPFVGFNPKDPYHGKGTVEAADDYIKTDEAATKFTKNFFHNNAGLSGILSFKGEITKPAFRKAVRAWRDKYQGVDNAGKVMMVRDSDANFTKVGLGLDELDMSALRDMSREDIAIMFGVPLPLLGKADVTGLGRSNIEALEYIFTKYSIEPRLIRLDHLLNFALQRYWSDSTLSVRHENIIPEDKEHELAMLTAGVDKWITRNEARSDDGAVDIEGGDQLFVPMANIPLNEASTATPAAKSAKGTGVFLKVKRITPDEPKKEESAEKTERGGGAIATVHKENFRVSLMRNQKSYERRYRNKFLPILKAQQKEALDNLEAHSSSLTKDFNQKLFDDANADKEMQNALVPVLRSLGETQGALALLFAGDTEDDFRMTASYEALLRKSTMRMAKAFNDETLDALNKTLAEGIQDGEALDKLKSRVEEVYQGADGYRSLRVARTETLGASNSATNEAYRQTGYVTEKQWYANPGADEECLAFDGKTMGLDESFIKQGESFTYTDSNGDEQTQTNSYDDVDSPPLHPNCRCTIIPVK